MYEIDKADPAFIYELNAKGENKWFAHVQQGRSDDDARFPYLECVKLARLMACSPELLEALEELLSAHDFQMGSYEETPTQRKVRGVLAKAKGEQQ